MKIAVAGTGYVGLSIATLLSQNNEVVALDIIPEKVETINKGISPIKDEYIEDYLKNKNLNLRATLDYKDAFKDAEFIVISTPTNYDDEKNFFDTSSVEDIIQKVISMNIETTMVVKSTIPVGFIEEMKKKYWDATHNCSAFVIGDRQQIQRCSDDGEPQGTAGRPMLDVLLGEDIHNMAVVVTRYFGGTLLGTGGLVRAYSKSVQVGLEASEVIEKRSGFLLKMAADYNGIGKIQYILGKKGLPTIASEYGADVTLEVLVPEEEEKGLKEEITEGTSGRTVYQEEKAVLYAILSDGTPLIEELPQ